VPTRARLAVAVAIALLSAVGIAVLTVHWLTGGSRAALPPNLRETRAVAPFAGYRESSIVLGGRCVRVVVADTAARRERGLRGAGSLGPYAGMLFAQPHGSDTPFTMAGVGTPLEITWYSGAGASVGSTALRPCPDRGAAQCPVYAAAQRYRFALETPAGGAGPAHLVGCG
jgi:uncharacterized membrane protein (UPF0127 family)